MGWVDYPTLRKTNDPKRLNPHANLLIFFFFTHFTFMAQIVTGSPGFFSPITDLPPLFGVEPKVPPHTRRTGAQFGRESSLLIPTFSREARTDLFHPQPRGNSARWWLYGPLLGTNFFGVGQPKPPAVDIAPWPSPWRKIGLTEQ